MDREEAMLSFELTAIDLILTVGVVVLFILYVRSSPNQLLEGLFAQKERPRHREVTEEDPQPNRTQPVSVECPYLFGYLRIRGDDVPIPEACVSCPRKQQCLGNARASVSNENVYVA